MKAFLGFLAAVVLIGVALFLLHKFHLFPFGSGSGDGNGSGSETSVSSAIDESSPVETTITAITTNVEEITYVDVTVNGNSYIYQNQTMELDQLLKELDQLDPDITVKIKDERASLKAYQNLTDALDDRKLNYEDAKE